jgi:hypothetical protein
MIKASKTKTVGTRPDDYTIVSLMVNECNMGWGDKYDFITVNILKNNNGTMTVIQQHLSLEDVDELASTLYQIKWDYERRQREKKEATAAEAGAQGIGTEKAEA